MADIGTESERILTDQPNVTIDIGLCTEATDDSMYRRHRLHGECHQEKRRGDLQEQVGRGGRSGTDGQRKGR